MAKPPTLFLNKTRAHGQLLPSLPSVKPSYADLLCSCTLFTGFPWFSSCSVSCSSTSHCCQAKPLPFVGPALGRTRARPVLQCRCTIWTGLRSALLRRCALRRELCCCRSSRRISDSYFLLEMLGSAAPQTIRIKHSGFFPLPARFRCWDGLVFTLSLPAFSGWRLCSGKVRHCCPRIVSSHAGKMLGRG